MMPLSMKLAVLLSISAAIAPQASGQQMPIELPPTVSPAATTKSLSEIEIRGLQTIPADVVQRKLASLPDIVEASHPSVSRSVFHQRIQEAIQRGFLSSGFLDCQVQLGDLAQIRGVRDVAFIVSEGPRFRRGEIRVMGASETSNRSIAQMLSEQKTDAEKPKLIWEPGKTFSGSVVSQMEVRETLRGWLDQWRLNAKDANIGFVRDEAAKQVHLTIKLAPQDALWVPLSSTASEMTGEERVSALVDDAVERQFQQIYQQNFATPQTGCTVVTRDHRMQAGIGFGSDRLFAEMRIDLEHPTEKREQTVCVLMQQNQILVSANQADSTDDISASTWRLPSLQIGFVLTQQAASEVKGDKTLTMNFNWETNANDESQKPMPRGFQFSPLGWQEWFPAESTKVTQTKSGKLLTFGSHELLLDQNGKLVSLQGVSANGSQLEVHATSDQQIEAHQRTLIREPDAKDILVRDPASGQQITLARVFQDATQRDPKKYDFFISPANGDKSIWGVLLLATINQESVVKKESLIAKLATLYALQLSGYQRTLKLRMDAIEVDAKGGPLTSFALADIAQRCGQLDQASELYANALLLAQHQRSLQRDLRLIFDDQGIAGQVAMNIDIKSMLQLGLRLVAADSNTDTSLLRMVLSMMPEATDQNSRRENCQLVAGFVYQAKWHVTLVTLCESRMTQIKQQQLKIAAKAKAKKKKKNKAK